MFSCLASDSHSFTQQLLHKFHEERRAPNLHNISTQETVLKRRKDYFICHVGYDSLHMLQAIHLLLFNDFTILCTHLAASSRELTSSSWNNILNHTWIASLLHGLPSFCNQSSCLKDEHQHEHQPMGKISVNSLQKIHHPQCLWKKWHSTPKVPLTCTS